MACMSFGLGRRKYLPRAQSKDSTGPEAPQRLPSTPDRRSSSPFKGSPVALSFSVVTTEPKSRATQCSQPRTSGTCVRPYCGQYSCHPLQPWCSWSHGDRIRYPWTLMCFFFSRSASHIWRLLLCRIFRSCLPPLTSFLDSHSLSSITTLLCGPQTAVTVLVNCHGSKTTWISRH
ncbi:hypothetical protein VUR80DRAFT_4389 [Thermomyces stellatus]